MGNQSSTGINGEEVKGLFHLKRTALALISAHRGRRSTLGFSDRMADDTGAEGSGGRGVLPWGLTKDTLKPNSVQVCMKILNITRGTCCMCTCIRTLLIL